ncbi:MAG TPA: ABC transporter substrate-binding protein [Usitatibacter sp.]|nr:ABC transporter substrate-binding protein [Usitatibacter sp.]
MVLRAVITAFAFLLGGTALAQGVTETQVVLGQSAAFTGPSAQLGKDMRDGAMLYFDQVNARGGVFGRRIELKSLDDGYEPARAAANTKKLIEDEKVFALFGYVGTPTSQAVLPIFTGAKVPYVAPFTGAEFLRHPTNPYVFNIRASYFDETEAIVRHLTAMSIDNIAIFYQNDAYGQAGLNGVERALKKRNMSLSVRGTVERNTLNVAKAVADITKANPQSVIMIGSYKACAEFIREMKKQGQNPTFWNVSFVGSKALAEELGPEGRGVEISQVMPFPWDISVPVVREYRKLLDAKKMEPGFGTLEGFIAAKVMVEGLRRAGKKLDRQDFLRAMESMNDFDAGGFKVSYGPQNHSGSNFVDLTIISRNQTFVR